MPLQTRTFGRRSASPLDVGQGALQGRLQHDAEVVVPSSRISRYRASVSDVVEESSMSMRTKLSKRAASSTTAVRSARQRPRSSLSPRAVSLTLTFEPRPSPSIASKRAR